MSRASELEAATISRGDDKNEKAEGMVARGIQRGRCSDAAHSEVYMYIRGIHR